MCGIVGLFLKDAALEPKLGAMLADMLAKLGDRGPDSAGFAIYSDADDGIGKITVQSSEPAKDFAGLAEKLSQAIGAKVAIKLKDTHAVLSLPIAQARGGAGRAPRSQPASPYHGRRRRHRDLQGGRLPDRRRRAASTLRICTGTHGIGHTRMATELAVTTLGAHPFSTGPDECLVHNGSLSNHNNLRRELMHDGMTLRDRERHRGRRRLSHLAHEPGARTLARRWRRASPISTASTPSWSAPRPASACCAIRSPASRRCSPRPAICRLRLRIPRAGRPSRHR